METSLLSGSEWLPYAALAAFFVLALVALFRMGVVEAVFRALGIEISMTARRKEEEGQKEDRGISVRDVAQSELTVAGRDMIEGRLNQEPSDSLVEAGAEEKPIRVTGAEKSRLKIAGRDMKAEHSDPDSEG